ncbi:MAG TPA: pseudouridine synthase [Tepidisphaeraceae bacterium]|nr:pseudouridine synthase [Tepidisphaeraceae bacterium]
MKERIQKVLAAAGVDSRRHIEQLVREGRIAVNGRTVERLPVMVDPASDKISIDGDPVRLKAAAKEPLVYVLLNKPRNVYCTNVSQGEQRRAIDLLPRDFPRVYSVGRLDHDSRGLLILTNDGDLTHRLTHPKFEVLKTYLATVEGQLTPEAVEKIQKGVWLADVRKGEGFRTGRAKIRVTQRNREQTSLEITIGEGRNREIRRLMAKVGHKVRDLIRIRFGPLKLEGVNNGKWRMLTPTEVNRLRAAGSVEHEPKAFASTVISTSAEKAGKRRAPASTVSGKNPNQLKKA